MTPGMTPGMTPSMTPGMICGKATEKLWKSCGKAAKKTNYCLQETIEQNEIITRELPGVIARTGT